MERGPLKVGIHFLAIFVALDVEGVGDCCSVVDGIVDGDNGCTGRLELRYYGVHGNIYWGGLVACGAVEKSIQKAEPHSIQGTGCKRSSIVDSSYT